MLLTLPILEVLPATPRARIVRLDLGETAFDYTAGQALVVGNSGQPKRRAYSIAGSPEEARTDRSLELLVGVDEQRDAHSHMRFDVTGPWAPYDFVRMHFEG